MKKIGFIVAIVLMVKFSVFSQQMNQRNIGNTQGADIKVVSGTLTEIVDNKIVALPFANVFIEGTTNTTTTDFDGKFQLETNLSSFNLKCTFMGYDSYIKSVYENDGGVIHLDILMKPESTTMKQEILPTKS